MPSRAWGPLAAACLLGGALAAGGMPARGEAAARGGAGLAHGQTAVEALAARDRRAAVYGEVDGGARHVMAFLEGDRVAAIEVEDLSVAERRLDAAACRALGAARADAAGGPAERRLRGREETWLWPARAAGSEVVGTYVSHEAHRARCRLFERREPRPAT